MTPFKSNFKKTSNKEQKNKPSLSIWVVLVWLMPICILWLIQLSTNQAISFELISIAGIVLTLFVLGKTQSIYINK
jgi:hypothetical protein